MKNIGIIGAGNMGGALISGLLKEQNEYKVFFCELNKKLLDTYVDKGAIPVDTVASLARKCEYIILAVKPSAYLKVIDELNESGYDKTIITIAPGITRETIKNRIPGCRVVRTMPNTPALISMGVTLVANDGNENTDDVNKIFKSIGEVYQIPEKLMNAGVALSGSSPAYVYSFINAIADGASALGIPKKASLEIAANTVIGSALMILKSGKHPIELLDNVCSPGGTTIEAVNVLKDSGFESAIINAMKACKEKSEKLS